MSTRHPDLPELLAALDPDADLATRHVWLVAMLAWIRGEGSAEAFNPTACLARMDLLLDAVSQRPDWVVLWQQWWKRFRAEVDLSPMLADFGFAPRTAFMSELGHRLRQKLLPKTPETTDMAALFGLLFPTGQDTRWLNALPTPTLHRIQQLLLHGDVLPAADASRHSNALTDWDATLMDALTFCTSQITATGFASEVRVRMSAEARQQRTFHRLPEQLEAFRQAVHHHGPRSPQALSEADALRTRLDECRRAADTVYAHLDEHGISVGIVFRLRQLRERVLRIRELLDCLQAHRQERASVRLLAHLVQVSQDTRSVRALIASSTHLTAAKVAERSAETGEHYITRNWAEYRDMLKKAAGGGAIIGLTTWGKFLLYGLTLSAFWAGFAAGLNYALSFVVVQLLHLTVATKQPAVTAPAMVAKLKDLSAPGAVLRFVDEVAHLFRSQVAAIAGNLAMVVPVVLIISWALQAVQGQAMITPEQAHHVLHDLDIVGPTLLFAAFTGVLLFASSIVAGWCENWFVLHRLDSAMTHNPAFTQPLGAERAQRWAHFMRANVSGFAANISLGLMLGVVPAFAAFFGLGLEVRHVTLSAGQVAAAVAALGTESLGTPGFWLAVAGVLVVGPINLGMSFFLAFRLALRAQAISDVNRRRIHAALRNRMRRAPLSFLLPPKEGGNGG